MAYRNGQCQLAPVLVTSYARLVHFKRCIESLSRNSLADRTSLYVAIDAPFREQDVSANKKIIDLCNLSQDR